MAQNLVEILLIEDEPNDVELTLRALHAHNLANRVRVLRDGAEALAYLFGPEGAKGQPISPAPKLILLDLKMPKVDGLEVLRQVDAGNLIRSGEGQWCGS